MKFLNQPSEDHSAVLYFAVLRIAIFFLNLTSKSYVNLTSISEEKTTKNEEWVPFFWQTKYL